MSKILITGSSGFLGTYISNKLSISEMSVIKGSISKKTSGFKRFLPLYSDIEEVLMTEGISDIIHCASVMPSSYESATYEDIFLPNIEMMNNLYKFALRSEVKRFIYISGFGTVSFEPEFKIEDFYSFSKLCGEHFVSLLKSKGICASSLRISAPYGEYLERQNVINNFVNKALKNEDITLFGSGKREQNFIYAGDIFRAINLFLNSDTSGTYNIVASKNISMLELANIIVDLTNSNSNIVHADIEDPQENFRPNYDYLKTSQELGFIAETEIEEGLKKYIEWLSK